MARKTLTDRKVQSIKAAPKGKRSQTMDGLVPGFGVRVTGTGAKTYIFQARCPGSANQARREIAKVDAITLEAARDKAKGWAALIKQGLDPAQVEEKAKEEQAQVRANTFGRIMGDYFDRQRTDEAMSQVLIPYRDLKAKGVPYSKPHLWRLEGAGKFRVERRAR